jgi:hypothetical protein
VSAGVEVTPKKKSSTIGSGAKKAKTAAIGNEEVATKSDWARAQGAIYHPDRVSVYACYCYGRLMLLTAAGAEVSRRRRPG